MKLHKIANPASRPRGLFAPRLTLLLALSLALASTGSLDAASSTPVEYTVIDLGDLGDPNPSEASSEAYAINVHNQVVGGATTANGDSHAFLYSGGEMIDLGTLITSVGMSGESVANGINDQGVVVGSSDSSQGGPDAFYYETTVPGAQMVDFCGLAPGGGLNGWAYGINNLNEIVGSAFLGDQGYRAFFYSIGGAVQYVPPYIGSLYGSGMTPSLATAVNSAGNIVGNGNDNDQMVPFISDGWGTWSGTSELPGNEEGSAYAINSSGVIVGALGGQAVEWIPGNAKGAKALGYLRSSGNRVSAALGINYAGQIVGYSDVATNTPHAIIYQNGKMTDLNNLIAKGQNGGFLTLSMATAINDSGAIAGYGVRTAGGSYFAFLAIPSFPTPLP